MYPQGKFTTLDLCYTSSDLYQGASIELTDDLGSDHTPIIIKLNFKPISIKYKRRRRWIFKAENWSTWRQQLPSLNETNNLEENYNTLVEGLISTSEKVFHQTKENSKSKIF